MYRIPKNASAFHFTDVFAIVMTCGTQAFKCPNLPPYFRAASTNGKLKQFSRNFKISDLANRLDFGWSALTYVTPVKSASFLFLRAPQLAARI
jgi:hypothetical protein